jgi:hypothetical protein
VNCAWCGSWHGVREVRVNGQGSRVPMMLCYRCFGIYAETGERPFMPHPPIAAPNRVGSVPLTRDLLRRVR